METLSFVNKCLKDFNYPNIHNLTEDEIANIYKKSNRLFLVAWLFKQLNTNYETIIGDNNDKQLLGQLLSSYGFCSLNEGSKFLECELSLDVQINILYKIFKFYSNITTEKNNKTTYEAVSNDDITNLINLNMNLFPSFGPIQKLTTTSEHKKEIEELKNRIEEIENNKANEINNIALLDANYAKLTEISENFASTCENLKKNITGYKNIKNKIKNDINFDEQSSKFFNECNENLKLISKFIKNINSINNFCKIADMNVSNSTTFNLENYNELGGILKEMKELFQIP